MSITNTDPKAKGLVVATEGAIRQLKKLLENEPEGVTGV